MAVTATVTLNGYPNDSDNTQRHEVEFGTIALAGTYVTGGFLVTWNPLAGTFPNSTQTSPVWVDFQSTAGYEYIYNASTGKVQIWVTGTASGDPGNELASAATAPTDTIQFRAEYLRD